MNKSARTKRITANLPADLLEQATKVTGSGITETLIQGLQLLKRSSAFEALPLKGKINLDLDLDISRERTRR
jgi:hypothetical protein